MAGVPRRRKRRTGLRSALGHASPACPSRIDPCGTHRLRPLGSPQGTRHPWPGGVSVDRRQQAAPNGDQPAPNRECVRLSFAEILIHHTTATEPQFGASAHWRASLPHPFSSDPRCASIIPPVSAIILLANVVITGKVLTHEAMVLRQYNQLGFRRGSGLCRRPGSQSIPRAVRLHRVIGNTYSGAYRACVALARGSHIPKTR